MNRHFDKETGRMAQIGLQQQVELRQMFPTIRATDGERGGRGDPIQAVRGNPNNHYRLWPTPCTPNGGRTNRPEDIATAGKRADGRKVQVSLESAVKFWPTPRASECFQGYETMEACKDGNQAWKGDNRGATLTTAVMARNLWPTPTKSDGCGGPGRSGREGGLNLRTACAYPTPNATDYKGPSTRSAGKERQPCDDDIPTRVNGSVNPDWVELLMGWPKGWTILEPLESAEMRGWGDGWEDGTPRVATGIPARVQRLKAIGNGQVPQAAALAWRILSGVGNHPARGLRAGYPGAGAARG